MERVEQLESQLTQEHSLRSAADSYLLELQQSRQRAASCLAGLRDGQSDTAAHCNAVKWVAGRACDCVCACRRENGKDAAKGENMSLGVVFGHMPSIKELCPW